MELLSYRGPDGTGGVSSALKAIWCDPRAQTRRWWHLDEVGLRTSLEPGALSLVSPLDSEVISGHYRFCAEFLSPLMHGLKSACVFRPEDYENYVELQQRVATELNLRVEQLLVNDYQFAMIPDMVSAATNIFWHIPWPDSVEPVWQPFVRELAMSLLKAQTIGFQCEKYAANFLSHVDPAVRKHVAHKVTVAPVGIDAEMWQCRATEAALRDVGELLPETGGDYILSVDRADCAKGVLERLDAIELFFERNPDAVGNVAFVQVCERGPVDEYWTLCRRRESRINERWAKDGWKPIVWIEQALSHDDLALLYVNANALLVTSLKDGLNLTTKEFAMCQTANHGVTVLSMHAGVWHELRHFAITIDPYKIDSIVSGIESVLRMPDAERKLRSTGSSGAAKANTLINWFRKFQLQTNERSSGEIVPLFSAARGKVF